MMEGGFACVSSCQQLLWVLAERLQQASLEVFFRYFRNQELQQQIKYAEHQVSEGTQHQQQRHETAGVTNLLVLVLCD